MIRRVVTWTAAAVLIGGLALAGYRGVDELAEDGPEEVAEELALSSSVADVRTLRESHAAEGSIAYDTSLPLAAPIGGTVLEATDAATAVESGDVILRVDDVAVVWLDGEIPAWRTLRSGDAGPDVEQLEQALVQLGFDPAGDVELDEDFDANTETMVEAWQASIGVEPTGVVELGTVVFGGVRDRVARTDVVVGSQVQAGDDVMAIDAGTRIVTFEVTPEQAVDLEPGASVTVELPQGDTVEAFVESALADGETVTVVARFGTVELPSRDSVAVDVSWELAIVEEAVTVPSSALLRLDNGTYVVDVVAADGSLERRPVEIGASVGTRTEIRLGLSAGDEVVVL